MNKDIIVSVQNRVKFLSENRDRLVVDADVHLTDTENLNPIIKKKLEENPNYYQGRPVGPTDLIREMKMAKVDMCLVWQNPAATVYTDSREKNFQTLLAANKFIYQMSIKYPDKFIPAGWTDPRALGEELAVQMVETCILEFGFAIVKMNPAQNAFPIDSPQVFSVLDRIVELGAIPAFHYGADTPFTPASGLRAVAERHPNHPVIGVHMGGGGAGYVEAEEQYHQSRELGLELNNIFFIQSAKRDTHIESDFITYQLAGEPYSRHIACASDAPYGRMTWNFGGYRKMFESFVNAEEHTDVRLRNKPDLFDANAIQNYLGRNLIDLAIKGYQSILLNENKLIKS